MCRSFHISFDTLIWRTSTFWRKYGKTDFTVIFSTFGRTSYRSLREIGGFFSKLVFLTSSVQRVDILKCSLSVRGWKWTLLMNHRVRKLHVNNCFEQSANMKRSHQDKIVLRPVMFWRRSSLKTGDVIGLRSTSLRHWWLPHADHVRHDRIQVDVIWRHNGCWRHKYLWCHFMNGA